MVRRFFHWMGHALFDMDCAVHLDNATGAGYCKKCGRKVMPEDGRATDYAALQSDLDAAIAAQQAEGEK